MDYQSAVTTVAEENDLPLLDAEIAIMGLLTGDPCPRCTLPVAVADIDGVTCCCDPPA